MSRYRRGTRWMRSGHVMGSRRHPFRFMRSREQIVALKYAEEDRSPLLLYPPDQRTSWSASPEVLAMLNEITVAAFVPDNGETE